MSDEPWSGDGRTVGIVGGTGPAGSGLALRLAAAGVQVSIGSREAERARTVVDELRAAWPGHRLTLRGVDNETACDADLVVVATPWAGALAMAPSVAAPLRGKPVVSMANALTRAGRDFLPLTMPRGSVTAELQALLPDSRVVGAFHHLPAPRLLDLDQRLDADVLVVGQDDAAKQDTIALVAVLEGLRGLDAGSLAGAGAVEALTAVLIRINVSYRTHTSLKLVGELDSRADARTP